MCCCFKTGTGNRTGTGVPTFECTSGENVSLANLCDGNADCAAGDDEITPLCESEPHVIKHSLINCSYARVSYCTFCNR